MHYAYVDLSSASQELETDGEGDGDMAKAVAGGVGSKGRHADLFPWDSVRGESPGRKYNWEHRMYMVNSGAFYIWRC